MTLLPLLILLIAAGSGPQCRRYGQDDFCRGEVHRDEHDVLAAANRPTLGEFGSDAIRVSSSPALGGEAVIVEAVRNPRGDATVAVYVLYGHPRLGWRVKEERQFRISAVSYRSLGTTTERALARASEVRAATGDEIVVCTDGPGYLTERVRGGQVATLSGFCPRSEEGGHPNISIVCAMQSLLDLHRRHGSRIVLASDERCSRDAS